MISFIDKTEYKSQIVSLWMDSFRDGSNYVEFFLDNCQSECVGFTEDDKLVSMLFLLEGNIDKFKLKYIYAACTNKQFRGRGIMGELIEFAKSHCKELGYDGIFLVPGEESLYRYYSRFGFESLFFRNDIEYNGSLSFSELKEIDDIQLVTELRNELLTNIDSFVFDQNTSLYAVKEHLNNGGKIYLGNLESNKVLIFCYFDNINVIIKELLCSNKDCFLKFLEYFTNSDTENVYIRCPIVYNRKDIMAENTKCGMCYIMTDELKKASVNKSFYAGIYLD